MALSLGAALTVVLAGALGVFCIVFASWQARPGHPPANSAERLSRSVIVGFAVTGGIIAMVIIVGALEPQFRWSWGGVLGVGCVAIPLQLMATIGAYVQFGYMRLMQQKLTKIARKHSIRPNEDDLDK